MLLTQVPVLSVIASTLKVTVDPFAQETIKSGVVSLVILSVFDVPLSVAVAMSGVPVALGAVVSMVIERFEEMIDTFPALSV